MTDNSAPKLTERTQAILAAAGLALLAIAVLVVLALTGEGTVQPPPSSSSTSTTASTAPAEQVKVHENPAGAVAYSRYGAMTNAEVEASGRSPYGGMLDDRFAQDAAVGTAGHPQGQFRISCVPAFWSPDDPILFPGEHGGSHWHMFFGNSDVSADTVIEYPPDPANPDSLMNRGGSTCQSDVLNRSAYWMPAMFTADRDIVVPELITLYYTSHRPADVSPLPPGVEMFSPPAYVNGEVEQTFRTRESLNWGCDNGSQSVNWRNTIPGADGTGNCPDNQRIQATIQFPQCFAVDSNGDPVLKSPDHVSHTLILENENGGQQTSPCPSSHPYRGPQISYLVKFANPAGAGETGWHLSSDLADENGVYQNPGGSLHADWAGGWAPDPIQGWLDGCFLITSRNCSLGLTGSTARQFLRLKGEKIQNDLYTGPKILKCPECQHG